MQKASSLAEPTWFKFLHCDNRFDVFWPKCPKLVTKHNHPPLHAPFYFGDYQDNYILHRLSPNLREPQLCNVIVSTRRWQSSEGDIDSVQCKHLLLRQVGTARRKCNRWDPCVLSNPIHYRSHYWPQTEPHEKLFFVNILYSSYIWTCFSVPNHL